MLPSDLQHHTACQQIPTEARNDSGLVIALTATQSHDQPLSGIGALPVEGLPPKPSMTLQTASQLAIEYKLAVVVASPRVPCAMLLAGETRYRSIAHNQALITINYSLQDGKMITKLLPIIGCFWFTNDLHNLLSLYFDDHLNMSVLGAHGATN